MGTQIPKAPGWTPKELQDAVIGSRSIKDICLKLGLIPAGGNASTIRRVAEENGIDLSVLDGQRWRAGSTDAPVPAKPLKRSLVRGFKGSRSHIKERLIKEGLLKEECAECGSGPEWRGNPLVLVLDHINGVNDDYRLGNLRLLCPNCNSQTKTFSGRNCKR